MIEGLKIHGRGNAVCVEPDGKGGVRTVWQAPIENVVVDQGKANLFNRAFGFATGSTFGPYLIPHSGTTASNNVWSNISASSLGSYTVNAAGTSIAPQIAFGSAYTNGSATGSASYAFTAGTQTLSGFCIAWFTTNTLLLANLSSAAGICIYNNASVASQQIQSNNTVSVSVTLSLA